MPLMKFESSRSGSAGRLDVGEPGEQLAEHHLDLAPGEVGTEAEVRSRGAEADVRVGVPADVEAEGVLEDLLVAVGRVVEEEHLVAGFELDAGEHDALGVLGDGPSHPDHRRGPPHHLVGSGRPDPDRVRLPAGPLLGVLGEGDQGVGDRVAGGLVAGGEDAG